MMMLTIETKRKIDLISMVKDKDDDDLSLFITYKWNDVINI